MAGIGPRPGPDNFQDPQKKLLLGKASGREYSWDFFPVKTRNGRDEDICGRVFQKWDVFKKWPSNHGRHVLLAIVDREKIAEQNDASKCSIFLMDICLHNATMSCLRLLTAATMANCNGAYWGRGLFVTREKVLRRAKF